MDQQQPNHKGFRHSFHSLDIPTAAMLAIDRSPSVGSYSTTNLPIIPVPSSIVVCAGTSFILLLIFSTTNETEITEGVEGPGAAEEMLTVSQRVLEESAPVLVTARHDAEECRTNIRLREEDDAAYRAALGADLETITLSKQLAYYEEYQKKLVGIDGKANASSIISGSVNLISSGSSDFVQSSYINPLLYKNYTPDQLSDILIQSYATFVQVEGARSPEEMLKILQSALEESSPVVTAWHDAEEWRTNIRLREERDAAYRVALEADHARAQPRKEELAREAAEAERKRKEEEEAREREAGEAAEKEAALARLRQENALSLGAEPEKRTDVAQVLMQFPTGERRDWRFQNTATIQSLHDMSVLWVA